MSIDKSVTLRRLTLNQLKYLTFIVIKFITFRTLHSSWFKMFLFLLKLNYYTETSNSNIFNQRP